MKTKESKDGLKKNLEGSKRLSANESLSFELPSDRAPLYKNSRISPSYPHRSSPSFGGADMTEAEKKRVLAVIEAERILEKHDFPVVLEDMEYEEILKDLVDFLND